MAAHLETLPSIAQFQRSNLLRQIWIVPNRPHEEQQRVRTRLLWLLGKVDCFVQFWLYNLVKASADFGERWQVRESIAEDLGENLRGEEADEVGAKVALRK